MIVMETTSIQTILISNSTYYTGILLNYLLLPFHLRYTLG